MANLGSAGPNSFSFTEQPPNPSKTGSPALDLADWAKSLRLKAKLEGPAAITALAISPDGNLLVAGGDDGVIRFWDPQAGQLLQSWTGHEGSIETLAISPDGTFLVSGGALTREFTVCLLDGLLIGVGRNAEHSVVIFEIHRIVCSSVEMQEHYTRLCGYRL